MSSGTRSKFGTIVLGVVHQHTSWITVVMYLVPHSGWLLRLRSNYLSRFFMAYTNTIWCTWQRTIEITKSIATPSTHLDVAIEELQIKRFYWWMDWSIRWGRCSTRNRLAVVGVHEDVLCLNMRLVGWHASNTWAWTRLTINWLRRWMDKR